MRETQLTTGLAKFLRNRLKGSVVFKLSDAATSGVPDVVCTYGGSTCWVEGKRMNGSSLPHSTELQRLTMRRLASHGRAAFVVWWQPWADGDGGPIDGKRTYIVRPAHWEQFDWKTAPYFSGHDFLCVAQWVAECAGQKGILG